MKTVEYVKNRCDEITDSRRLDSRLEVFTLKALLNAHQLRILFGQQKDKKNQTVMDHIFRVLAASFCVLRSAWRLKNYNTLAVSEELANLALSEALALPSSPKQQVLSEDLRAISKLMSPQAIQLLQTSPKDIASQRTDLGAKLFIQALPILPKIVRLLIAQHPALKNNQMTSTILRKLEDLSRKSLPNLDALKKLLSINEQSILRIPEFVHLMHAIFTDFPSDTWRTTCDEIQATTGFASELIRSHLLGPMAAIFLQIQGTKNAFEQLQKDQSALETDIKNLVSTKALGDSFAITPLDIYFQQYFMDYEKITPEERGGVRILGSFLLQMIAQRDVIDPITNILSRLEKKPQLGPLLKKYGRIFYLSLALHSPIGFSIGITTKTAKQFFIRQARNLSCTCEELTYNLQYVQTKFVLALYQDDKESHVFGKIISRVNTLLTEYKLSTEKLIQNMNETNLKAWRVIANKVASDNFCTMLGAFFGALFRQFNQLSVPSELLLTRALFDNLRLIEHPLKVLIDFFPEKKQTKERKKAKKSAMLKVLEPDILSCYPEPVKPKQQWTPLAALNYLKRARPMVATPEQAEFFRATVRNLDFHQHINYWSNQVLALESTMLLGLLHTKHDPKLRYSHDGAKLFKSAKKFLKPLEDEPIIAIENWLKRDFWAGKQLKVSINRANLHACWIALAKIGPGTPPIGFWSYHRMRKSYRRNYIDTGHTALAEFNITVKLVKTHNINWVCRSTESQVRTLANAMRTAMKILGLDQEKIVRGRPIKYMHDIYYLWPQVGLNLPEVNRAVPIFRGDPRYPNPNKSAMTDDLIQAVKLNRMVKNQNQSIRFPNPQASLQILYERIEKKTILAKQLAKRILTAAQTKVEDEPVLETVLPSPSLQP